MSEYKQHNSTAHTAYDTQPAGLEKALDNFYHKTITLNLPTGGRKWLADNSWWLALIGGLLGLWGAWTYWSLAHYADAWINITNEIARTYGGPTTASLGFFWYVTLVAMALQAVLLLLAVQGLKAHKKSGWNLLFYSSLVSLLVGVLYLFLPAYGVSNLIGMVIGTLVGWFFLFQIRNYFTK